MVADVLTRSGIQSTVYAGAGPNPTDAMVMNGVEVYKEQHCDLLVAIGGGSAMDVRRGSASSSVTVARSINTKERTRCRNACHPSLL